MLLHTHINNTTMKRKENLLYNLLSSTDEIACYSKILVVYNFVGGCNKFLSHDTYEIKKD